MRPWSRRHLLTLGSSASLWALGSCCGSGVRAAPGPPGGISRTHGARSPSLPGTRSADLGRYERGIYVNLASLEDDEKLQGLLRAARAFRLECFVVDLWSARRSYRRAVSAIQDAGLKYIPRIVVFPDGGTEETVLRRDYWDRRWAAVETALELGARRIQLDYLRYRSDVEPDRQHAFDILEVLRFFSQRIRDRAATLEIDVFGDAAGGPSERIGQDLRLFGPLVDGVCPMAYPSHYEPHDVAWTMPREIVSSSVKSAKSQLGAAGPRVTAWIEMFNFRYPMTEGQRADYVRKQLQGAALAGAGGWYAWSSTNSYGLLFALLGACGAELEAL